MNKEKMAAKLKELREEKGMTQKEVAEALSISESAYSQYEIGMKVPRDDVKVEIARFFDTSILAIFFSDATHCE